LNQHKEDHIFTLRKENEKLKQALVEKSKNIEYLNFELEIVKKERNENFLQIHNLAKEKPFHAIKDSMSSLQSLSTINDDVSGLPALLEKTSNEKSVLENMLFEFKIKYAEIQNKNGEYRDQNDSLRRKLDDALENLAKKEEIIRKFMMSKEKIPFIDHKNMGPSASRLDLTIALTEGAANQFPSLTKSSNLRVTRYGPQTDRSTSADKTRPIETEINEESKYMSTSPADMTFVKISNSKSNYRTNSDQKAHDLDHSFGLTPEKHLDLHSKDPKNKGSFFKKIKNLFFTEKKKQTNI